MSKTLQNGAVYVAFLIFSLLLVKEWFEVRAADAAAPPRSAPARPKASAASNLIKFFNLSLYADQRQFLYRLKGNGTVYVPEPQILDKLDFEVLYNRYLHDQEFLQKKAGELHIDLNTVLVRPIPENIRFLALEENSPPTKQWQLFLMTGSDTATLLEDGIHLRRQGLPERILGGPVSKGDERIHGEMGAILWQPVDGRWKLGQDGQNVVSQVAGSTIDLIKDDVNRGPLYRVDCNITLRQFVQPFQSGESFREMILKVDVPVSDEERAQLHGRHYCELDLRP